MPFQIYIGGRGLGKTFSTLTSYIYDDDGNYLDPDVVGRFMYIRETVNEIKISTDETANPFKKINDVYGCYVYPEYIPRTNIATFYRYSADLEKPIPVGYGVGLSTFANLRGVDFSDVTNIVYDEFIKQRGSRKLANAGTSLLNLYETVNRNREFEGKKPVTMKLLANAVSLNSEILLAMGAVSTIAHMVTKHQARATIPERQLYIEIIRKDDFKVAKSTTALYQLAKGTSFSEEALDNVFVQDDMSFVRKVPLSEYTAFCTFGNTYTLYRHKTRTEWYISQSVTPAPIEITSHQSEFLRSRYKAPYYELAICRKIYYDTYGTKLVFDALMGIDRT